jgi:hypothetical protein
MLKIKVLIMIKFIMIYMLIKLKKNLAKIDNNYENQHLIKIDKPIEFGQAIDLFHKELHSFDLMED